MKLCGWEVDVVFRRYSIADVAVLREGVAKPGGTNNDHKTTRVGSGYAEKV